MVRLGVGFWLNSVMLNYSVVVLVSYRLLATFLALGRGILRYAPHLTC